MSNKRTNPRDKITEFQIRAAEQVIEGMPHLMDENVGYVTASRIFSEAASLYNELAGETQQCSHRAKAQSEKLKELQNMQGVKVANLAKKEQEVGFLLYRYKRLYSLSILFNFFVEYARQRAYATQPAEDQDYAPATSADDEESEAEPTDLGEGLLKGASGGGL